MAVVLVARQTITERQASIAAAFVTGVADGITAETHREINLQLEINNQVVYAFLTLQGTTPTMDLLDGTFSVVPVAAASGGAVDAVGSVFDNNPEIVASFANQDITTVVEALYKISGSIIIEPPSSNTSPAFIHVDIELWTGSQWDALGFRIDATQEYNGKGTHLSIPAFNFVMQAGWKVRMIALTDTSGGITNCPVREAFLNVELVPNGIV